jgi:hypothetical protein
MKGSPTELRTETIIFWAARVLAVIILAFWGFFIVAHLMGTAGEPSRQLTVKDYSIIASMLASLVGLGLACQWERLGATLTLIAVAIGAVLNWRILLFPSMLIPATAVLFLVHAQLRNARENRRGQES